MLVPDLLGFVIVGKYGEPEPLQGELEHLGDELPGQFNSALLEVVAE